MPETTKNNPDTVKTIDGIKPLTYEQFRFKPHEHDPKLRQPFNNFYFYFYTGRDAEMTPIDVYLLKPWFLNFKEQQGSVLKEAQDALSDAITKHKGNADQLSYISRPLYKAYLTAREYATDIDLFS